MSRSLYSALLFVLIGVGLFNIHDARQRFGQSVRLGLKVLINYLDDLQSYLGDGVVNKTDSKDSKNHDQQASKKDINTVHRCKDHKYKIRVIARNPFLIYIENFVTPSEIAHLIQLAEPLFQQSVLYDDHGKLTLNNNFRTSSTADLERHETPLVECLERRFAQFQGGIDVENLEPLQVVRYTSGQEFKPHYDWFSQTSLLQGTGQRISTFFTYLYANCTGGETEFIYLRFDETLHKQLCDIIVCDGKSSQLGIRFRPIAGNSIFWYNVDDQGKGDRYTYHAGRPPKKDGLKIGLNTWTHQQKVFTKKRQQ